MPLTLAIDCAMRGLNLGLADAEHLYGEESMNVGNRQSELLPEAVAAFLARHGKHVADLERIAVTVGPGYYTGIRVGIAYATSLAESLNVGVVPFSTLYAMVCGAIESGLVLVPVLRAKREALYGAVYAGSETLLPPVFSSAATFPSLLDTIFFDRNRAFFLGGDAHVFPEIVKYGLPVLPGPFGVGAGLAKAAVFAQPSAPDAVRGVYLREPD